MGKGSSIEWTHHTFNPWWGCVRVSPGCQHCYAETFAKRVGQKVWGVDAPRRFFGDKHWSEPLKWDVAAQKAGERHRVFCASMADVFEDRRDLDEWRHRLWNLIDLTPNLDWLLLTKRPENFDKLAPGGWVTRTCPANVWMGTTVEDQQRADERVPALQRIPARIRFLSCEPLLGGIDIGKHRPGALGIHWVILGGESGHGARPCEVWWIRNLIGQCRDADVAPFVKQLGKRPYVDEDLSAFALFREAGDLPGYEAALKDAKGGDWNEWPDDLRVRELP